MEENSPTDNTVETTGVETNPTSTEQQEVTAEQSTQETSSGNNTQESVSDDTANTQETAQQKQTEETGGESQTDDGLTKFAKSQGFDPDNLTDGERKALKIAHDNQKFARSKTVAEAKASVDGDVTRDEIEEFRNEFRSYQSQKQAEQFFAQEGKDDSLAGDMHDILREKQSKYGDEYARVLSQDLDLLYNLALVSKSNNQPSVDEETIRRQERESIRNQSNASDTPAHATTGHQPVARQITEEWLATEYNSNDPEQRAMVDKYYSATLQ